MRLTPIRLKELSLSRGFRRMAGAVLTAAALQAASLDAQAVNACIDVALVLSMDGSSSVSPEEYLFQKRAAAAALRDEEVQRAMAKAGVVAISAVSWGSAGLVDATPWTIIQDPADAEQFASQLEQRPRKVTGDTNLGGGLAAALAQFNSLGACASRSIINVSGDGRETVVSKRHRPSPMPDQVKAEAAALDVTINALVISNEEKNLAQYYADRVITGPGAFVMEVKSYADYAEALKRKLIREIGPTIISRAE